MALRRSGLGGPLAVGAASAVAAATAAIAVATAAADTQLLPLLSPSRRVVTVGHISKTKLGQVGLVLALLLEVRDGDRTIYGHSLNV